MAEVGALIFGDKTVSIGFICKIVGRSGSKIEFRRLFCQLRGASSREIIWDDY